MINHYIGTFERRTCLRAIMGFGIMAMPLAAQNSVSGYTQPILTKSLRLDAANQVIPFVFWVDQTTSLSVMVSSLMKNLELTLKSPLSVVFTFGQPVADQFQCYVNPDPLVVPDAPGAHYHMDLTNPTTGQWTLQITAPTPSVSAVMIPVRIAFNNQVAPVLFGGGGSHPLGEPVSFSVAILDGTAKVANPQINARLYRMDDATANPVAVPFADDGQGADYAASDAIYSAYLVPAQLGQYMLQVELAGDASTGHCQRSLASNFKVVRKTAEITGKFTITPRVKPPQ